MRNLKAKNSSGFTIIEVIIATTIISITIFALMSTAQKGIELSNQALRQSQANTLLEEGVEALKSIRDVDWDIISNLTLETDYYLFFNTTTNTWVLDLSSVVPVGSIPVYPIDSIFTRKIVIFPVNRDSNDDITEIGTLDIRTKKIEVTVSWVNSSGTKSKTLSFYLIDIFS